MYHRENQYCLRTTQSFQTQTRTKLNHFPQWVDSVIYNSFFKLSASSPQFDSVCFNLSCYMKQTILKKSKTEIEVKVCYSGSSYLYFLFSWDIKISKKKLSNVSMDLVKVSNLYLPDLTWIPHPNPCQCRVDPGTEAKFLSTSNIDLIIYLQWKQIRK